MNPLQASPVSSQISLFPEAMPGVGPTWGVSVKAGAKWAGRGIPSPLDGASEIDPTHPRLQGVGSGWDMQE